uniref:COP9 signalosome subunit 7A n=1 Tax=Pipistrellus kuhlii TaxID=59472 RepID=A0A7J7ZGZ9_PIPKU|nr:COP9 signalosome subunit 7A [Pipistrellus kuhlii]
MVTVTLDLSHTHASIKSSFKLILSRSVCYPERGQRINTQADHHFFLWCEVKCIPYAVLLEALALRNVRQLEDLVIEAVYADVLRGSLDQRNQRLEVDYSIGRDIQRQDLSAIARTLQEWCVGCEVVLSGIEEQVSRANQHKEQQLGLKQQIESEVANLKKTIKVTTAAAAAATSQDPEQHLTELREPAAGTNQRQPSKKASKGKGLRGSAKIWSKSN